MSNIRFVSLSDVCDYVKKRISVSELSKFSYISTENMLPDKTGIVAASTLPAVVRVSRYKDGDILTSNS